MQHIQDKDFDRLFKDKFEDAEIEPSANLWNSIEQGMAPKRKRVFPAYWMAAAVVTAVLTAGLMFFNQEEKIQLQAPVAIKGQSKPAETNVLPEENPPVTAAALTGHKQVSAQLNTLTQVKVTATTKVAIPDTSGNFVQKDSKPVQPATEIARLTIKPDMVKEDNPRPDEVPVTPVKETMIASTDVPVVIKDEIGNENDQAERKGIRNVGDLINYVVDKVDKREDKFIQFNTDSDDNSSLIGINLGMIKFSHKRHK
jgi:hypothetical protein